MAVCYIEGGRVMHQCLDPIETKNSESLVNWALIEITKQRRSLSSSITYSDIQVLRNRRFELFDMIVTFSLPPKILTAIENIVMNSFIPDDIKEYLRIRVDERINWYNKKVKENKRRVILLNITQIVVASLILLLTGFINYETNKVRIIVGVLGLISATITGVIMINKFHENWIRYKTVAELLKLEKFHFLSKTEGDRDSPTLFVERIERILDIAEKGKSYFSNSDVSIYS